MRNPHLLVAFFAASFLLVQGASGQKIGEVPKAQPTASAPRETTLEWTSTAGRPFWYRLPSAKSRQPNLIVMLHGTGLNHGWSFWNYGIDGGNFRPDDIIVSPDGCTPGGATFNFVQNDTDGDQIASLIEGFRKEFEIGNVYLYGHSQGAFFCYWFAGEHPHLVNGIVAHAGNVLNVKHPKLAIESIAIGILHAASDQVVSVECARRTETIYRDRGYQKLNCNIVEGIRAQAGHWPLPEHVKEMLAWCDEVCVNTVHAALALIEGQWSSEAPDLVAIGRARDQARDLLKSYKGEDQDTLEAEVDALDIWFEAAAAAAAGAISSGNEKMTDKADYGGWVAQHRLGHFAFKDVTPWRKVCGRLDRAAVSQTKKLKKALAKLERAGNDGLENAVDAYLTLPLADGIEALEATLTQAIAAGDAADEPAQVFAAAKAVRAAADAAGRKALFAALPAAPTK